MHAQGNDKEEEDIVLNMYLKVINSAIPLETKVGRTMEMTSSKQKLVLK